MKVCASDCYPICDFCRYFIDPPRTKHGAFKGETGWCRFHNEQRDLTDMCEEFHCMTLPVDGEIGVA